MIKFRQKEFVVPVLAAMGGVGGAALMAGGTAISAVQGKKANKIAQQQGEEAAAEQARANREMERIARQQAADQKKALRQIAKQNQNPTIVPMMDTINTINGQQPLEYPQQNSYSSTSILSNLFQKSFAKINMKGIGQTGYDVIKGIRNSNGNVLTGKWLRNGLAMGAGMTGVNYLVDKGIQIDRKRSGMPELEQREITDKEKKKNKTALITAGLTTAGLVAGGVAAKKGSLGTSWKKWADNNLTKKSLLTRVKTEPKKMGKALKENAVNWKSLAFGGAFAVPTVMNYAAEKKAIKDQTEAQKNYSEEDNKEKKSGSLLKKAAIGTALAAGTIAAGRRGYLDVRGGGKVQMATNNLIARTGKVFKSQRLQNVGAQGWGVGSAKESARRAVQREQAKIKEAGGKTAGFFKNRKEAIERYKANPNAAKSGEKVYKNMILTRDSKAIDAVKHPLRTVLSGADKVVRLDPNGGRKNANNIVNNIRKAGEASGNKGTQQVADFLGKHKTLAIGGSLGVGALVFKPFTWGDKLVRGGTKVVDKNSFAYENRNQENIE